MKTLALKVIITAVCLAGPALVSAAQSSAGFGVRLTMVESCTVTTPMSAFGQGGPTLQQTAVQCLHKTPYSMDDKSSPSAPMMQPQKSAISQQFDQTVQLRTITY